MAVTDNLSMRLDYRGGSFQQDRMIADKVRSLKKALLYSYQAGTVVLSDGRKFRGLFNPDKTTGDLDNKILSIPYADIAWNDENEDKQKTSEGIQDTDIKNGDVITWEETNTHWLVYLEAVEEYGYFRSDIRRCDQYITINDNTYWVYIRGPVETQIDYNSKSNIITNNLNYSLVMYITRNEETDNYFHRFSTVKIGNVENTWEGGEHFKTWEVQAINPYFGDGIIAVYLDEYYENEIKEAREAEIAAAEEEEDTSDVYISGNDSIKIYGSATYTIEGLDDLTDGYWGASSEKIKLTVEDESTVKVSVLSGRSFDFVLSFVIGDNTYTKNIEVKSF